MLPDLNIIQCIHTSKEHLILLICIIFMHYLSFNIGLLCLVECQNFWVEETKLH